MIRRRRRVSILQKNPPRSRGFLHATHGAGDAPRHQVRRHRRHPSVEQHQQRRPKHALVGELRLGGTQQEHGDTRQDTRDDKVDSVARARRAGKDVRQQGDETEEDERRERHHAVLPRRVVLVRGHQPELLDHHDVEEEILVLGHHVDDGHGVLLRHAPLHVQLHHLAFLTLGIILQLPLLPPVLRLRVVDLRLRREVVPEAHREAVRDEVGEAHEQDDVTAQAAAHGRGDDRERGDDAIETAKHQALDVLASIPARVRGRGRVRVSQNIPADLRCA
mmetsp:Transcript_5400/g.20278  ORF Transcript_5400/g.20278 Transcript_5400/m.20278 type:complete len:277 (-) Transcript_5400:156-986(-)